MDRKVAFLKKLQSELTQAFEAFEPTALFVCTPWDYQLGGGGGEIRQLRGEVFEKAAVNWSGVAGDRFPMQDGEGRFFATGVSLITHMRNPHAPTAHLNLRYIETQTSSWYAGCYDLTPMGFPYPEDTEHFHRIAKQTLDTFDHRYYPDFSKQARDYFYLPHRHKERGVGGIFFDHLPSEEPGTFELWQAVGLSFLDALLPIYQRRIAQPHSEEERETQLRLRAHYVEFNLLYDRGTRFGFLSQGNPEAILCSMPPVVKW